ncbi:MAG TPA: hypothetical protein VF141_15260, partial [Chryseolinea sp.]
MVGFVLEALMVAFIFASSWSFDTPKFHTAACFEPLQAEQLVLRNPSSASEFLGQALSKFNLTFTDHQEFLVDVPAISIATSEELNVDVSLR